MSKRLPRPKLTRGLFKAGIIKNAKDMKLVDARLKDPVIARKMNDFYATNRGNRWIGRLRIWGQWLFKHREEIFQILGIVVLFLDDGSQVVMDAKEAKEFQAKRDAEKKNEKPSTETPDGEKVEDFTEVPGPSPYGPAPAESHGDMLQRVADEVDATQTHRPDQEACKENLSEQDVEKAAEYYGIGINTPLENDNDETRESEVEAASETTTEIGPIVGDITVNLAAVKSPLAKMGDEIAEKIDAEVTKTIEKLLEPLEPEVQAVIDSQLEALDNELPAHWYVEDEHEDYDCNPDNGRDGPGVGWDELPVEAQADVVVHDSKAKESE